MAKRQSKADKLHTLRCQLIEQAWQERVARKHGNKDVEAEAALERDITTRAIQKAKGGKSR